MVGEEVLSTFALYMKIKTWFSRIQVEDGLGLPINLNLVIADLHVL